jgi:hypothetical protein
MAGRAGIVCESRKRASIREENARWQASGIPVLNAAPGVDPD